MDNIIFICKFTQNEKYLKKTQSTYYLLQQFILK